MNEPTTGVTRPSSTAQRPKRANQRSARAAPPARRAGGDRGARRAAGRHTCRWPIRRPLRRGSRAFRRATARDSSVAARQRRAEQRGVAGGHAARGHGAREQHHQLAADGQQCVERHQGENGIHAVFRDPLGDAAGDAGEDEQTCSDHSHRGLTNESRPLRPRARRLAASHSSRFISRSSLRRSAPTQRHMSIPASARSTPRARRRASPCREGGGSPGDAAPGLSKVPEVTAYFWIVKALTTGMGSRRRTSWCTRWRPEIAVVLGRDRPSWSPWRSSSRRGATSPGAIGSPWRWSACSARWPPTCCTSGSACPTSPRRSSTRSCWPRVLAWYRTEGTLSIHSIDTPPARAVLLGRRARHVRARHRRRRPDRRHPGPRLLRLRGCCSRRSSRSRRWATGARHEPISRSGSPTSSRGRSERRSRIGWPSRHTAAGSRSARAR